jgi:prophage regulatory protein
MKLEQPEQGNAKQPLLGHPRLLRLPAVLDRCGCSKAYLYREIAAGRFPRPITIGHRYVAWNEAAVDDWILRRIIAADQQPSPAFN